MINTMKRKAFFFLALLCVVAQVVLLTSCSKDNDTVVTPETKEYFLSWNQCEALTALKTYVEDVTNPNSEIGRAHV